jgi:predicted porin
MKKLVITTALAAIATTVSAQNVEVYGKMRLYTERDTVGTASAVTKQTNDTSRLGFRGSEDLGGGLKANFTIETSVFADNPNGTNSSIGDRTSLVGLSNQYGRIDLGRRLHPLFLHNATFDALGNEYASTADTIHSNRSLRLSNSAILTATPIKGLAITHQHSSSETAGTTASKSSGIQYSLGDLTVGAANFDNGAGTKSSGYGAKYKLPGISTTALAMYSEDEVSGVKTQGKTVGIQQPLAPKLTAMLSYGEKQDVKAYALGVKYDLSKRTFIQARMRNEDSTTNANDRKQFGLGIEHNF